MRVCACESRPTRGPPLALNILPRPDPDPDTVRDFGCAPPCGHALSSANTKNDDSKGLLLCSCSCSRMHGADGTRSPSQGGGKVQCTRPARAPRRRVASLPRLAGWLSVSGSWTSRQAAGSQRQSQFGNREDRRQVPRPDQQSRASRASCDLVSPCLCLCLPRGHGIATSQSLASGNHSIK